MKIQLKRLAIYAGADAVRRAIDRQRRGLTRVGPPLPPAHVRG